MNTLPLEQYVDAVVGSEVPSSWPPAALEAQAVAARSFTLASLGPATAARAFDVYSDTRSQVYGGIVSETPAANAAVSATAHQAVVYGGNVAQTLFSSSSGGETVSAAEVTGSPVPYLRSVPDPYDALSPYHDWGPVAIDAAAAAKALHLAGPLIDLTPTPGPSGHNATVTAVGPTTRTTLTGTDVRLALGLRSTWFQVGWLTLVPSPSPVVYGRQGTLDGIARGLAGVTLQAKTPRRCLASGRGGRPRPVGRLLGHRLAPGADVVPARRRHEPCEPGASRGRAARARRDPRRRLHRNREPGGRRCLRPASASRRHGLEERRAGRGRSRRRVHDSRRAGGGHVPCAVRPGSRFRPGVLAGRARLTLT